MKKDLSFPLFVSALVIAVAVAIFWSKPPSKPQSVKQKSTPETNGNAPPLICHVGGTMRPVIQEIGKRYTAETGRKIEINSAGSGELLAHIQLQKEGDIYISHDPFLGILMNKYQLGVNGWQLSELTPVMVVQKGNPKKIHTLQDLARPDVRVILTDFKYSTLGRMLPTIFHKAGMNLQQLTSAKKIVTNKSGGYAANYVKMNNADVALVWNAVAYLRRDALDVVPITAFLPTPGVDAVTSATKITYFLSPVKVTAATLRCSKQPQAAEEFLQFLVSPQANKVFADFGFTSGMRKQLYANGKATVSSRTKGGKTVKLYAGAGLRRAVERLTSIFKQKTGITVETDYGGSGMIMARARESRNADLFMPGDVWYVDHLQEMNGKVAAKFPVAYFVPVIIVQKGNPKKIKGLQDFLRPDLKVALGRAKACQIGRLCKKIFAKNGIDRAKIPARESLTVNELGVWVKMKAADTSIVWDAIANNISDAVDTLAIPPEQNIISRVVIARLKSSQAPTAANQFIEFISGPAGKKILRELGYRVDKP